MAQKMWYTVGYEKILTDENFSTVIGGSRMNGKKFDIEREGKEYCISLSWSDWEGFFSSRMSFKLNINDELVDEGVMAWQHYHWVCGFERDGHQFTLVAQIPKFDYKANADSIKVFCYVDGISQTDGSDLDALCERLEKVRWRQKITGIFKGDDRRYHLRGVLICAAIMLTLGTISFFVKVGRGMTYGEALLDVFFAVVYSLAFCIVWSATSYNGHKKALIRQLKEQSKIAKKQST